MVRILSVFLVFAVACGGDPNATNNGPNRTSSSNPWNSPNRGSRGNTGSGTRGNTSGGTLTLQTKDVIVSLAGSIDYPNGVWMEANVENTDRVRYVRQTFTIDADDVDPGTYLFEHDLPQYGLCALVDEQEFYSTPEFILRAGGAFQTLSDREEFTIEKGKTYQLEFQIGPIECTSFGLEFALREVRSVPGR